MHMCAIMFCLLISVVFNTLNQDNSAHIMNIMMRTRGFVHFFATVFYHYSLLFCIK